MPGRKTKDTGSETGESPGSVREIFERFKSLEEMLKELNSKVDDIGLNTELFSIATKKEMKRVLVTWRSQVEKETTAQVDAAIKVMEKNIKAMLESQLEILKAKGSAGANDPQIFKILNLQSDLLSNVFDADREIVLQAIKKMGLEKGDLKSIVGV